jgi:hypothetical protein
VLGAACGWLALYLVGLIFTMVAVPLLYPGRGRARGAALAGFGLGYLALAGLFGIPAISRELAFGDPGSAAGFAAIVLVGPGVLLLGVREARNPEI